MKLRNSRLRISWLCAVWFCGGALSAQLWAQDGERLFKTYCSANNRERRAARP
jgi:hypothetical protein